jgi:hypothetical protein
MTSPSPEKYPPSQRAAQLTDAVLSGGGRLLRVNGLSVLESQGELGPRLTGLAAGLEWAHVAMRVAALGWRLLDLRGANHAHAAQSPLRRLPFLDRPTLSWLLYFMQQSQPKPITQHMCTPEPLHPLTECRPVPCRSDSGNGLDAEAARHPGLALAAGLTRLDLRSVRVLGGWVRVFCPRARERARLRFVTKDTAADCPC